VAEGRYLDIKKENRIKFEVFADEYLQLHCKTNNKCWLTNDSLLLIVLKRHFSGKYLDEITPHLIEKFKSDRIAEVTPATVNRHLACLKSLFNKAILWNKFKGTNPVRAVKLFKENNQRLRFLEREEINKLLSVCNRNLRSIVTVALNTGMRRGEILGLKWRDLDVKRSVIYLHNTKNGEKRELPINEQVKTALIRVRKHPQSEYIFYKEDGSHMGDIKKSFLTALRKSGIKDFHFHDLRHTFASQLVMSGADLNTVRELLGHKSIQMTLRYSHLSPNHKQRAVDVLGRRIATVLPPEQLPTIKPQRLEAVKI
jgi:integrase